MSQLVPPHGGRLVDRILTNHSQIEEWCSDQNLFRLEVPSTVLVEAENLAHGCFSPLQGFPGENEIVSILNNWQLRDGKTFPIPPVFAINEQIKNQLEVPSRIILTYQNTPFGIMDVEEIFPFDKEFFMQLVFRTADLTHPGAALIARMGNFLLAGKVSIFERNSLFFREALTPKKAREIFSKKGWKTIAAFSTTNVPHRAHEYLQRCALEMADGLFIHALQIVSGNEDEAKYPPQIIAATYQELIHNYLPEPRIIFSLLPQLVRSAGPRSSVLQAIIRQNFGCSHQIFGRDHEGFSRFYGRYESQEIFTKFSDLHLQPLCFKEPYYCPKCELIVTENSCPHAPGGIKISGTEIRKKLKQQEPIEPFIVRPEIRKILSSRQVSY